MAMMGWIDSVCRSSGLEIEAVQVWIYLFSAVRGEHGYDCQGSVLSLFNVSLLVLCLSTWFCLCPASLFPVTPPLV